MSQKPSVLSCTSNFRGCQIMVLLIRIPRQQRKMEVHSLVWNKWWANHWRKPPGSFWTERFASGCFSVFLDFVWTADKDKIIDNRCKVKERQNWENQHTSGKFLMGRWRRMGKIDTVWFLGLCFTCIWLLCDSTSDYFYFHLTSCGVPELWYLVLAE